MQMKVFRGFTPSQLLPSMITRAWQENCKRTITPCRLTQPCAIPSIHAHSQGQALRCCMDLFCVHCWGKAWEIEPFRLCPLPAICSTDPLSDGAQQWRVSWRLHASTALDILLLTPLPVLPERSRRIFDNCHSCSNNLHDFLNID